jgi:serine protease Do
MTKTKTRFLTALLLTTALTAPALIVPTFAAPPAVVGQTVVQDFSDLAAKVSPAVVNVSVTMIAAGQGGPERMSDRSDKRMDEFMKRFGRPTEPQEQPRPTRKAQALGTGFIVDAQGTIVTNFHVVGKADSIVVTMTDGTKLPAKLLGGDEKTDLAVLKVDSAKPLPFVAFGDADKVRVGQAVMAVGNPFGLGGTVTTGIVSARGRDINSGPFDDYIQTDAAINRGNSGGPLFDMDGKVIGINTAIFSPTGGSIGLGFAIPSSLAEPIVAQLRDSGRVERGLLGVQIQPLSKELAESLSLSGEKGALVSSVQPDSPALAAGLKAGDVILSVDGKPIDTVKTLTRTISAVKPGGSVALGVWRDGKDVNLVAKVGDQNEDVVKAKADGKSGESAKPAPTSFGVSLAPLSPDVRQKLELDDSIKGVLIAAVEPGGPADEQGLKAGDVLQQVGRDAVDGPKTAADKLKAAKGTGKPVLMKVYREGATRFVAITPRAA